VLLLLRLTALRDDSEGGPDEDDAAASFSKRSNGNAGAA
jgi:hypothetical protein